MRKIDPRMHLIPTVVALWVDAPWLLGLGLQSRTALAAENLFLRKQLALSRERQVRPRRPSNATRLT
jgi:hypothetical protein